MEITMTQAEQYADEKAARADQALALRTEKATLSRKLRERRAEVAGEVAGETNGDGKPAYSNEAKREAETQSRLVQDEAFRSATARHDELDMLIGRAEIAKEHAADLLAICLAFAGK